MANKILGTNPLKDSNGNEEELVVKASRPQQYNAIKSVYGDDIARAYITDDSFRPYNWDSVNINERIYEDPRYKEMQLNTKGGEYWRNYEKSRIGQSGFNSFMGQIPVLDLQKKKQATSYIYKMIKKGVPYDMMKEIGQFDQLGNEKQTEIVNYFHHNLGLKEDDVKKLQSALNPKIFLGDHLPSAMRWTSDDYKLKYTQNKVRDKADYSGLAKLMMGIVTAPTLGSLTKGLSNGIKAGVGQLGRTSAVQTVKAADKAFINWANTANGQLYLNGLVKLPLTGQFIYEGLKEAASEDGLKKTKMYMDEAIENPTKRNISNLSWSAAGDLFNLGVTGIFGDLSDAAKIIRQAKGFPRLYTNNLYKYVSEPKIEQANFDISINPIQTEMRHTLPTRDELLGMPLKDQMAFIDYYADPKNQKKIKEELINDFVNEHIENYKKNLEYAKSQQEKEFYIKSINDAERKKQELINEITVNNKLSESLGIPLTDSKAKIEEPLEYLKELLKKYDLYKLNLKNHGKFRGDYEIFKQKQPTNFPFFEDPQKEYGINDLGPMSFSSEERFFSDLDEIDKYYSPKKTIHIKYNPKEYLEKLSLNNHVHYTLESPFKTTDDYVSGLHYNNQSHNYVDLRGSNKLKISRHEVFSHGTDYLIRDIFYKLKNLEREGKLTKKQKEGLKVLEGFDRLAKFYKEIHPEVNASAEMRATIGDIRTKITQAIQVKLDGSQSKIKYNISEISQQIDEMKDGVLLDYLENANGYGQRLANKIRQLPKKEKTKKIKLVKNLIKNLPAMSIPVLLSQQDGVETQKNGGLLKLIKRQ